MEVLTSRNQLCGGGGRGWGDLQCLFAPLIREGADYARLRIIERACQNVAEKREVAGAQNHWVTVVGGKDGGRWCWRRRLEFGPSSQDTHGENYQLLGWFRCGTLSYAVGCKLVAFFIRELKAQPNWILFAIEIFFYINRIFYCKISKPESEGGDL